MPGELALGAACHLTRVPQKSAHLARAPRTTGLPLFFHANYEKWDLALPAAFEAYQRRWQVLAPGGQDVVGGVFLNTSYGIGWVPELSGAIAWPGARSVWTARRHTL